MRRNLFLNSVLFYFLILIEIIVFGIIFKKTWELVFFIIAEVVIFSVLVDINNDTQPDRRSILNVQFIEPSQDDIDNFISCSICLEENNENITKLNCEHLFHTECISEWTKLQSNCPICRIELG